MTSQAPSSAAAIICTSSCRAHHRLSTKGEIFSNHFNITKTQEGFHQPPSPLYHGGGVTLLVLPRVTGKPFLRYWGSKIPSPVCHLFTFIFRLRKHHVIIYLKTCEEWRKDLLRSRPHIFRGSSKLCGHVA